ncbi:27535_t:CDS:2, partial [Gigaspora margarita]
MKQLILRYWMGIISEYEKKHEIDHYEAMKEQLLYDLSIIDDKIKMAKEELAKIFNTNNVQNSGNEIHTNSGTISDLVLSTQNSQDKINASNNNTNKLGKLDNFGTSNSHYDKERMSTLTRDDINELGENQDDNVLQGIGTSSTSQADESINTSTQDDDSYNASNNTRINLGKEKMYSHARENTSNNAIVDL